MNAHKATGRRGKNCIFCKNPFHFEHTKSVAHSIGSDEKLQKFFILSNSDFSLSFDLHNVMAAEAASEKGWKIQFFDMMGMSGWVGRTSMCSFVYIFNYRLQLATDAPWYIYRHFNFASIFPGRKVWLRTAQVNGEMNFRGVGYAVYVQLSVGRIWSDARYSRRYFVSLVRLHLRLFSRRVNKFSLDVMLKFWKLFHISFKRIVI